MAAQNSDHDKARELAEKALDKLVEGDEAAGDKLIKQAEKIDPTAIDEVAEDLDIPYTAHWIVWGTERSIAQHVAAGRTDDDRLAASIARSTWWSVYGQERNATVIHQS